MESEEFEEPPLPEVESEPLGLEDLELVDAVGIDAEPGLDAALGDPLTGPGDVIVDEEEGSAMVLLKSYTTLDFLIGLFITLGASILNALGLNLVKLSHKQSESSRNRSSFRPLAFVAPLQRAKKRANEAKPTDPLRASIAFEDWEGMEAGKEEIGGSGGGEGAGATGFRT
ncbi:hypothetical protein BT69DRAFT_1345538 [Atractiella rhizophila]|nr:hypothetical protein BT69DRAFT_1345538 [Atractiella rhizophila]